MNHCLDPQTHTWMSAPETRAVIEALSRDGGAARFVGGAVRNALLNLPVTDIDIATPLLPLEVARRLEQCGIAAHPTGIEHGTITAVAGGKPFEVTTLRRDVETYGRRATVSFTQDWAEDAARRDFTINALYATPDGEIIDYVGGIADLDDGRVRFIGDARARIREDYLRILRLFRFQAWYGRGELDKDALAAAAAEKSGLSILSAERVRKELLRLLEAPNPALMLETMAACSIAATILPGPLRIARLKRLTDIDSVNFFAADTILRLGALTARESAGRIADHLKFSNAERERLADIAETDEKIRPDLTVREVRRRLYRMGRQRFKDRIMLAWAEDANTSNTVQWRALLALADTWQRPRFPVTGRDVIAAGVPEGPLVGRVLAEVEEWWIENDFTEDMHSVAERLEAIAVGVVQ